MSKPEEMEKSHKMARGRVLQFVDYLSKNLVPSTTTVNDSPVMEALHGTTAADWIRQVQRAGIISGVMNSMCSSV